jgi:hypothetical protein
MESGLSSLAELAEFNPGDRQLFRAGFPKSRQVLEKLHRTHPKSIDNGNRLFYKCAVDFPIAPLLGTQAEGALTSESCCGKLGSRKPEQTSRTRL